MPFFRKKSKSEKRPNIVDEPVSRPGTADSFVLPPRPHPRPPPFPVAATTVPNRNDTTTRASIAYDNGHGSLDHRLIEEQHLPPHIRTTDQLADFIRSRGRGHDQDQGDSNDRSSISSSHYSTGGSTFVSSADSARYTTFSVPPNPYNELSRPGTSQSSYYAPLRPSALYLLSRPSPLHNGRVLTSTNPMLAGLSRRYVSTPVVRVLPGTTRKLPFQGYWVNRGTMRKVPETQTPESVNNNGKHKGRGNGKKIKSAAEKYQYVETSGWYDD